MECCYYIEYNRTKGNKTREGHGGMKLHSTSRGFVLAKGGSLSKTGSKEELS